jgi:hypothetical protein
MSVEVTDEMVEKAASAASVHTVDARLALEAATPAIQEAVAYRIASKLNALSTERSQADDINAARHFKQAADVAVRVAKGGW